MPAERDGTMLAAAQRLCSLGLAVHWLRPTTGGRAEGRGKAPIERGWQQQPRLDTETLQRCYRVGYNLGIHTGLVVGARVQVVVVDCDDAAARAWCQSHLPPTPMEAQTRAGYHLYYRRPLDLPRLANRVRVEGIGLDVRADGGNVVVPPSVHVEGITYRWMAPLDADVIARLPIYQPEWLPQPVVCEPAAVSHPIVGSTRESYRRACAYARKTPAAVAGQGGSLATFKLAVALVRGFGLSEEQALAVMQQEYNPRCEPPWTEPELRHKLRYASAAGRITAGSLLNAGSIYRQAERTGARMPVSARYE